MVDMWSVGESRICAVCETPIFGDVGKFNTHITESHAISLDQYTTLHGSSEKKKKHCCLVCGEDVELLPGILAAHLQTHSLFPQQYYHKYICKFYFPYYSWIRNILDSLIRIRKTYAQIIKPRILYKKFFILVMAV